MAYIVIAVFPPKLWRISLISLLYISQGKPEFQTFDATWREQWNDNEGGANQPDLQFSIRQKREWEFHETCWIDHRWRVVGKMLKRWQRMQQTDIEERKDQFLRTIERLLKPSARGGEKKKGLGWRKYVVNETKRRTEAKIQACFCYFLKLLYYVLYVCCALYFHYNIDIFYI